MLAEALEAEVADVVPLPQLTENIIFAIRKACQAEKRSSGSSARSGRGRDRLLTEGRDR